MKSAHWCVVVGGTRELEYGVFNTRVEADAFAQRLVRFGVKCEVQVERVWVSRRETQR